METGIHDDLALFAEEVTPSSGVKKGYRMVQVEKHGNIERYKAVCFQCGCVFTFTEADEETDRESGKQYITCPDCGKRFRTPIKGECDGR